MSLLLVCLASWLPLISASGTSPSEPSFVPDPSGRGTVGLLWSCILTLWPCVWTAIHLNIPARHSTSWQRFLTKLPYAAVTLVFPEFMLLLVVLQFQSAWRFASEMNRVIASWNDSETASREPPQGRNSSWLPGLCNYLAHKVPTLELDNSILRHHGRLPSQIRGRVGFPGRSRHTYSNTKPFDPPRGRKDVATCR